jgi:hypothetical protein
MFRKIRNIRNLGNVLAMFTLEGPHTTRVRRALGTRIVLTLLCIDQSRSPSRRSSGRNARLWNNPFQGGI